MEKIFTIKKQSGFKLACLIMIPCTVLVSSCTKKFEEYNTDTRGITEENLQGDFNNIASYFPQIQKNIYCANTDDFQLQQNLNGDAFAGYMLSPNPFRGNSNNYTYALVDGWNGHPFKMAYENVMAPVLQIERKGKTIVPDFYAIAQILKVDAMHRVSDIYGPIPYSQYGKSSIPYDSQEAAYTAFFKDLDDAVAVLTNKIATDPTVKPFVSTVDLIYKGDYKKWIKFANSLRLRLAMRIVYADVTKAQKEAEKAIANSYGVFENNDDNALVSGKGVPHPLFTLSNDWDDARMSAPMESILGGYNDPRMEIYFQPSTEYPGTFKGIRQGIENPAKTVYLNFSKLGTYFTPTTPIQLMCCAEIDFLRAEGALRNWKMGGTALSFYEKGIADSFNQWGIPGKLATYVTDAASKPKPYIDPKNPDNNVDANDVSQITIKWDDGALFEVNLERIITQKWIAIYPDGQEAWSEFRRTGYPKLFPVKVNKSNNTIPGYVKRLNFPQNEILTNGAEVQKAVGLLGGPDNGGTKLWWDKKP